MPETTTPKKATGAGVTASISIDDGATYKQFASVTKIGPPSMTRGTVDVTDLNSFTNNNQMKEFLPGFIEAEEMKIDGFVATDDAGATAVETAFYSGDTVKIKVDFPAPLSKSMVITGIVTSYQPIGEIANETGIAYSTGIKPTKKPELTASAAG